MYDGTTHHRRAILKGLAGLGASSMAGCIGGSSDPADGADLSLEDAAPLPTLFDCNAWIGVPDDPPISHRLYRPPDDRGHDTPERLIAEMDRVGIDSALVYDVNARDVHDHDRNISLLDELESFPRLAPTWAASPTLLADHATAQEFVSELTEEQIVALRIFPGEHDYQLTDTVIRPLLQAYADVGGVLILDALSGVAQNGFTWADIETICRAYEAQSPEDTELTVIVTNLFPTMGTFRSMGTIMGVVDAVDNLYLDIARFQFFEGVRQFIDRFGTEKVLFGSHLPHASAGSAIAALMDAGLDEDEQHAIGNANLHAIIGDRIKDISSGTEDTERYYQRVPYGIIDMHGHIHDGAPSRYHPDAEGVVRVMDRTRIDLAVISQPWGGPRGNDRVATARNRHPDRLIPAAVADPRWDDPASELERCFDDLDMGIIKLHPRSHNTAADDPTYDPIWEFADEREALVVPHAICNDAERDAWIDRATSYPNLTLMLYHAGRGWNTADNFIAVTEAAENVLLEITFSYNVDGIIEYLIEQAGVEKVFWGSDIGARAPETQIGWAAYAQLDDEARWRHMRENARQLLSDMDLLPDGFAT